MEKKSKYGRMFVQASAEPNSFELCRVQPKMRGRNPKLNPKTHCVMVRFDDEEWNRFLTMYEESEVYAKAVFLKAHFFGQKFKVLKVNKTMVDYTTKLSDFHAQFRAIGTNYNQVVKELRYHFFGEEGDGVALPIGEAYHRPCEIEPGDCRAFKGDVG